MNEKPIKKTIKKRIKKRGKNKQVTANIQKTPPIIKLALRDLQTVENMSLICNEIKNNTTIHQPIESTVVCLPKFEHPITYTRQIDITKPKTAVPESPENMTFGEPDLQVMEADIILPGCYWGAIGEIPSTTETAINNTEKIFNKLKL